MSLKSFIISLIILVTSVPSLFSQTILRPNFSLKSHETLEIRKIETTARVTNIYLTIENRIEGGSFCADKSIFIIYPDGTRIKLTFSTGIPVCPDAYKFKTIGEKLDFTLTFPPLKTGTTWFDLIEDCNDNCFSYYGITLDNELNKKIDDAFTLVGKNEKAGAIISFINLSQTIDDKNQGIIGLIYSTIVQLAYETGDKTKASEWYHKLQTSGAPRLPQHIKYLNDLGIKY
jgi:hypothetical protein